MDFGTALWSSPAWQAAAVEWIDDRLADAGLRRTGEVEHPHVRAWATAVRVPTDRGAWWLKACGPGTAFEVRLYGVLAALVPADVLHPLAAGPALGRALGAAMVQYGALQRGLMADVARMTAAGVPDMRPAVMLEAFDRA